MPFTRLCSLFFLFLSLTLVHCFLYRIPFSHFFCTFVLSLICSVPFPHFFLYLQFFCTSLFLTSSHFFFTSLSPLLHFFLYRIPFSHSFWTFTYFFTHSCSFTFIPNISSYLQFFGESLSVGEFALKESCAAEVQGGGLVLPGDDKHLDPALLLLNVAPEGETNRTLRYVKPFSCTGISVFIIIIIITAT